MSVPSGNNNNNNNSNETIAVLPNFSTAFFNQVATLHAAENIIVSPLLLEAALALLFLGSDGATAEQVKRVLQLKRFGSNAKMANYYSDVLETFRTGAETSIFTLQRLLLADSVAVSEDFKRIALKYFHTAAENTDVANKTTLLQHINNCWRQTPLLGKTSAGIGETLFPSTSPLWCSPTTRAVLLNAAHFQSKWFLPFSAYRSGRYDFCTTATQQKAVPMMFDEDMFVKFGEFRELDARAIELPYEHEEELAMLILLPHRRDGLSDLERRLGGVDLYDLAESMQMESVQVLLPKFRIDFEMSLREILMKIGITSLFSDSANFSNMLKNNSPETLQFGDILHKVCIEVNESGSEASTKVADKPIVISNSIDSKKKFFRADHPFYFAIRSRDVIFFAGHVTNF